MEKINLVFSGSGVKVGALLGSYTKLSENYEFEKIVGTSGGSILASLIIAGYSNEELKNIMDKMNYKKLLKPTVTTRIPIIGKYLSLLTHKYMYETKYLEEWLNKLLKDRNIQTFGDICKSYNPQDSPLQIIVSDLYSQEIIILPLESYKLGINWKELNIAQCCIQSSSIPLFFDYKIDKSNKNKYCLVDGGLLSNFSLSTILKNNKSNLKTIGIRFKNQDKNILNYKRMSLYNFTKNIILTVLNRDESELFIDGENENVRIIEIDTGKDFSSINFNLKDKDKEFLYNCGIKAVEEELYNMQLENILINKLSKLDKE